MTCCQHKQGCIQTCSHDKYDVQLIADCSRNPVDARGAVHRVTIDNHRKASTLWEASATVTVINGIDPQLGIELEDQGIGTITKKESMGDIAPGSASAKVTVRRRSAGNTASRSIETLVNWTTSPNGPQHGGVNPQRHRCCTYTVAVQ